MLSSAVELQARKRGRGLLTVALCFGAAVFEGIDVQAMGIAAPKLIPEFHLHPTQFGWVASMSLFGLMVGAIIGGRLADRIGRKPVLIGSLALLGLFSLVTTVAADYPQLLAIRFLVGLGLGGAFPTLIALAAENAPGRGRALPISLMYAGIPIGTIVGGLMVLHYGPAFQWRWFLYLGGFGPLLFVPVLMALLPESPGFAQARARALQAAVAPVPEVLFGAGRGVFTVLLWLAFFFTLSVIYLLTNWLNQLMTLRGLSHVQATVVLLGFGVGSVVGAVVLGVISDTRHGRASAVVTYAAVCVGLIGMAVLTSYPLLVLSSIGTGFFAVGAQLVNYAQAPVVYPAVMRGTGVGWTVSIGRIGSFCGPLVGGLLLGFGLTPAEVLLIFVPGMVVAAIACCVMLWRMPDQTTPDQLAAAVTGSRGAAGLHLGPVV